MFNFKSRGIGFNRVQHKHPMVKANQDPSQISLCAASFFWNIFRTKFQGHLYKTWSKTNLKSQPTWYFKSAFQIKHFPIGSFQNSNFTFHNVSTSTVFRFPVNFYMYIFSLTLNSKFFEFLFTGSPTETNTLGRHFENICINWLFSDTEWSRGTRIYFLLWYHY